MAAALWGAGGDILKGEGGEEDELLKGIREGFLREEPV